MRYVLMNGECLPENEATIPLNERAFLFGDGVFTTILVEDGKICFLNEHLERLKSDCAALRLSPPNIIPQQLSTLIFSNHALKGEWRLKVYVTGGRGDSLDLPEGRHGLVFATLIPYARPKESGYRLTSFPSSLTSPLSPYKTMAYLERLYLRQYARDRGYDDVLVFSPNGHLLDTAFSNVFWTDGTYLYVPHMEMNYQMGTTLTLLIEEAERLEMTVIYGKWALNDLPEEACLYRCNSLIGVQAITQVDARMFGNNPTFEDSLVAAYHARRKAHAFVAKKTAPSDENTCSACG